MADSNSHGAGPVHLIISMINWIRTSRLSIKNSLSEGSRDMPGHKWVFQNVTFRSVVQIATPVGLVDTAFGRDDGSTSSAPF